MRLNPDCVRDILIEVEQSSTYSTGLNLNTNIDNMLFKKYSWAEITYHITQCVQAKLLTSATIFETDGYACISDLTPTGHEFLANIRQDTNWNKTKEIAKKVGTLSLSAIKDIASNVISEVIQSYFK